MKILVSGTGYVGLVTAVCLAEKGFEIRCFDVVKEKIDMLCNGKSPIYEPKLEDLMKKNKDKIMYTDNKKEAYKRFSRKMYEWAEDLKDRRQIITAIYLYVYLNRTSEEEEK